MNGRAGLRWQGAKAPVPPLPVIKRVMLGSRGRLLRFPGFLNPLDGEGFAGGGVDSDEGAADEDGTGGDGEPAGQGGGEAFEDGWDLAADDTFHRSAHAGIGEVGRAAGKDRFIGGLDVGVGADYGGDPAVEVPSHGDFFAGGFGVKVEEDVKSFFAEAGHFGVKGEEGVFHGRVHEGAAHGIDHGDFAFVSFQNDAALAGAAGGEIERPEQARFGFHVGHEFVLVPAMVAESDHRGAGAEQADAEFGGEAAAGGGVFAIDDDKVGREAFLEVREPGSDRPAAGFAKDIPQKKDPQCCGIRNKR